MLASKFKTWPILALAAVTVTGCVPRIQSLESYHSATIPNPPKIYIMDPGSYGGVAQASGGLIAGTSYGTGAKGDDIGNQAHYDQLAKVRGNNPPDWDGNSAIPYAPNLGI